MMGGLHIGDKMHTMIGKLLCGSGWVNILFLKLGYWHLIVHSQHSMNITSSAQGMPIKSLLSLYMLKQNAYLEYCENVMGPQMSFEMWDQHSKTKPQFKFWSNCNGRWVIDDMLCPFPEGRGLQAICASMWQLCGWFYALDHTNDACWLPVHVRDMVQLAEKHPNVHDEFTKGNFVVQKSAKKYHG